jgi:protein-S-isoprenylcysteine O-methyltransferase Ste14
LLVVYLGLGIVHAVFFVKLSKRTFIPQAMVMGFCFSRIVTMALRISWTENTANKNLAIAANVFVNAGVLLIVSHFSTSKG